MNLKQKDKNLLIEINTLLKKKVTTYDLTNLCMSLSDTEISNAIEKIGGFLLRPNQNTSNIRQPNYLFKIIIEFHDNKKRYRYYI